MKLKLAKKNFLGIDDIPIKEADVVIVPFGLEKKIEGNKKGTSKGPQKIIDISPNLEFFDEEIEKDVYKEIKISTIKEPRIRRNHKQAIEQLEKIVNEIYKLNKFPLIFGGEHSLTLGPVRAALEKYKRVSILQFDAHADLRDEYGGIIYSHASVMRQCLKLDSVSLTQIGIRNISTDTNEFGFWKDNQERIKTFWAKNMDEWNIQDILNSLSENVYLTFDVDAFDCSLMPSVGTPEPGGLQWYQTIDILKKVFKEKNVIGADIVELSPIKGFDAPDFVIAKLVYKIISYLIK